MCKLNNVSHLLLSNESNNYELIELSNLTNNNLSLLFNEENLNYTTIKVPYFNISKKYEKINLFLKSGFLFNACFIEHSPHKYSISFSVDNKKNETILKYFNFTKNINNFIISCFEQEINEIFCIFVSEQNPNGYITKINITHFTFDGVNLKKNLNQFLNAFNCDIKNIQTILLSQKEIALLFYKENYDIEFHVLENLLGPKIIYFKCNNYGKSDIKKLNLKENRTSFKIFEKPHKIYIEGHRGDTSKFYENTLSSFKQAIKNKLDSIELDVWLTKDNVPIVIHSQKEGTFREYILENEENSKLKICNVTYNYIKRINKANRGKEIPTLQKVLELCKNKIFINIKLKDPKCNLTFNIVTKIIEKNNMFNQVSLSSLNHNYNILIEEYNKIHEVKIECGKIYFPNVKPNIIGNTNGCSLNIHVGVVNEQLVRKAHRYGVPVLVYFRMEDEENDKIYNLLLNYGVDVICCNSPEKALKYRDKYYNRKFLTKN